MPYIKQHERNKLEPELSALIIKTQSIPEVLRDGSLNYIITKLLLKNYLLNYKDLNAAIGMLECVKQEFYRKIAAPYEEIKEQENGSI